MNSWKINHFPWSYTISFGLGYLVSHIVWTKFVIDIALLLLYYVVQNSPVTGSIIVMNFRFKFYFCSFILVNKGPIRSTQSLFHGISSASFAGNLPYFLFGRFLRWQVSQLVTYFWTSFLIPGQYKCWWIIASIISIPVWIRYLWYQCNTYFWSIYGIQISSSHIIRLRSILLSPKKQPVW